MADGTPSDVDRYVYHEDGSRTAYDASGNVMYTERGTDVARDYDEYGGTRERTDPMTGETYTSSRPTRGGIGPRGDVRGERRQNRQERRKDEEARRESRSNYYGGLATGQTAGIDDPWLQLQSEIPTADEYAGEHLTSELAGAQADQQAIEAQRAALRQLETISRGGMTAQERAAMQQAQMATRQNEKAQRDAIIQQAALRGMQGAGTTVGSQLMAQQAGANRYSQAQMDQQAMAQQRALQAMQMRGQLGGQVRGQSFGEDATRRSAVDDFARWNRGNDQAGKDFRFGASATTAQGTSQARATQAEQNRAMMENAQGRKTKTEKRTEQAQGLIGSVI